MKRTLLTILTVCGIASAHAALFEYSLSLTPVPGGSGTGSGSVLYDDVAHSLDLDVSWSGLSGNTTASHIHLPTSAPFTGTAGVVLTPGTLPGFPSGVTSGSYQTTLDLTSSATYPAAFITSSGGTAADAEAAVIASFNEGTAYWNIHTSTFGGGEINGFLTAVPEPSSLALVGLGVVGMILRVRSRRRVC